MENMFENLKIINHQGQKEFWPIPRHIDSTPFIKAGFKMLEIVRMQQSGCEVNYCIPPDGWNYTVKNRHTVNLYDSDGHHRGWIMFIVDDGLLLEASAELFKRYDLGHYQNQKDYIMVTITDLKKNRIRELTKSDTPITSSESDRIANTLISECIRKLTELYPHWQSVERWDDESNSCLDEDIFPE